MKKRLRWRAAAPALFVMASVLTAGLITREVSAATPAMQQEQTGDSGQSPAGSEVRKAADATVLGQEIRTADAEEMKEAIITRLFEQYAEQRGIVAEQSEIDAWVASLDRAMRQDKTLTATNADDLTPEEAAEIRGMRQNMARAIITQWKINRELHREYGGRIIFQQFGPEPLDAYRQFFEKKAAEGAFTIHNATLAEAFWRYFKDDAIHTFYKPGSKEEAEALGIAPWEQLGSVP